VVAVLARRPKPAVPAQRWRQVPSDPVSYAHELYAALRELDSSGCDVIVVESPPDTPAWAAVRDRLQRAAAGSGATPQDAT
jgi:L-threonylcarbamoyladenylate synthase